MKSSAVPDPDSENPFANRVFWSSRRRRIGRTQRHSFKMDITRRKKNVIVTELKLTIQVYLQFYTQTFKRIHTYMRHRIALADNKFFASKRRGKNNIFFRSEENWFELFSLRLWFFLFMILFFSHIVRS